MADTPDKSLRGKSVMPTLTVDDLSQSLTFFRGLGFEIEDRWEDNGVLMGAKLRVDRQRFLEKVRRMIFGGGTNRAIQVAQTSHAPSTTRRSRPAQMRDATLQTE